MENDIKKEARELITKDIKKCLKYLTNNISKNSALFDELTLISARYTQIINDASRGSVDDEKKRLVLNNIRQDILKCVEDIDTDMVKKINSGIFISHAPEDANLALAVEKFISEATKGMFNVKCNESLRLELESENDERELIHDSIINSNILLIIITPGSNERPLLVWESGFAYGKDKQVIYLSYFVKKEHIHTVFETNKKQVFNGESSEDIIKLTESAFKLKKEKVTDEMKKYWNFVLVDYLKKVEDELEISISKRLFHSHFHQSEMAENLSGSWYAKWTQIDSNGKETIFEMDTLHVWSSENRLRVIGFNSKKNIEKIKAENSGYYPMEGVISWKGWIALSYWSAGNIPICGTCLLQSVGLTGELLEGKWQGFTADDISKEPQYTRGRVIWSKSKEDIDEHLK